MTPAEELFKKIHLAVCDPGAYLPREREEVDGETEYESVTHWCARAVTVVLAEHEKQVREQVAKEARIAAAELTIPAESAILRWFAERTEAGGQ